MKKGFTLVELVGVVIILGIVVLLAFPPLLNMIRDANNEISKANETLLLTAADQYVDSYKNEFPKTEGNVYCVSYGDLVKDEKIPSNIPNKDGKTLDYNTLVKVTVNNGKYEYTLDNSCEKNVKITSLVELLKQQYKEDNTSGLLKDEDGSYYYKGNNEEVSNNFVWFAGHLWRVISINNDDTLTMITQQPVTALSIKNEPWFDEDRYLANYIHQWLINVFQNSLDVIDQKKIQPNTFRIGAIGDSQRLTTIQKVGLLEEDQYIKAGGQDSFLDIKNFFWLSNLGDGNNVQYASGGGKLVSLGVAITSTDIIGVRPVVRISNLISVEGEGTLIYPFREESTNTSTSNIKVGEYISIPTSGTDCGDDNRCLFRVVSKDEDSIKVILNGLLSTTSEFGSNVPYTSENAINKVLIAFANTISNNYRYIGNKSFNVGQYRLGQNYTNVQGYTYEGNVGLPIIGEIFSGNDIDIGISKTFVNVNTIENPNISTRFWMMNPDIDIVWYIKEAGAMFYDSTDATYGVRPVLFLKNNLTFTGGEGTAENPFTLD